MRLRLAALTALTLLAVAACEDPTKGKADAPDAPAPVTDAAPYTYENTTEYSTVSLTLPQSIGGLPNLHTALFGEGTADLRRFEEGAQATLSEYSGEVEGEIQPYSREIAWNDAGRAGRLVSLWQSASEYTGGAHPNTTYGAILWDADANQRIQPAALFADPDNLSALDTALCRAINAARQARTGEASALAVGSASDWACPRAIETAFVLEPSRVEGKAGGLVFLINPYVVGPYAEGPYSVVVPQSAFHALLAADYQDAFAGEPVRTGDVTPQA